MVHSANPREDSEHTAIPPKDPDVPEAQNTRQGRALVLCFDGTSNEFNNKNTNVVKLVAMLEKAQPQRQRVYYQVSRFR
jgi:uncharacterized protein (DUF2235 family)